MRSTSSRIFVPLFVLIGAGCGSDVAVDDGGEGGNAATTTATGTTAAVTTTAGPATTASGTSSSSNSGGSSGDGGSDVTSGGGADVTTTSGDGGSGAAGGGSVVAVSAASTGSGTEPFVCGQVECDAGDQCCASQQGFACIGPNDACQGATLTCQGAANCDNGDICCLQGDFQNAESVCTDECEATQVGPVQLCLTEEECPPGVPCTEAFGGFKVCSAGFP